MYVATAAYMEAFGARLAETATSGGVVFLTGELGTGKTTLVRGLLRALGIEGTIRSPTFTLVEPYQVKSLPVYHLDLYRVNDPEELELIGARDYFAPQALCLIEWPERGRAFLPSPDLTISLTHRGNGRDLGFEPHSERGARLVAALGSQPGAT